MTSNIRDLRTYAVEYFSGAQAAVFIGDTYVDEITSIGWERIHTKNPLYGYGSELWDGVGNGRVMIRGSFTLNFKESGYLWLVLDRYNYLNGKRSFLDELKQEKGPRWTQGTGVRGPLRDGVNSASEMINRQSIEKLIDRELPTFQQNQMYTALAEQAAYGSVSLPQDELARQGASLTGQASASRFQTTRGDFNGNKSGKALLGGAENVFEAFEDAIWRTERQLLDNLNRHPDDVRMNPFDIFLTYGDFIDNFDNHTVKRLNDVHIIGEAQQIVISGEPIQERYDFIARNSL